MTAAILVGILVAGGVYLVLQRELLRVAIGFVLLGHAVNVLFVAAGGMARREAPLLNENHPDVAADPLPQAFVLTAIVITFGITVYLLGLLRAGSSHRHPDPPEDTDGPPDAPRTGDPTDTGRLAGPGDPEDTTGSAELTGTGDEETRPGRSPRPEAGEPAGHRTGRSEAGPDTVHRTGHRKEEDR
ncbi:cation:proton antiporter subunit C [Streptomyces sp. ACA25]|uniref:sodium:proton antiporter n=1 Tax=Streptomyces sp. ACA25 TaxID=3022596 RepID=UPI002307DF99|nr:cation:proton antiporter subunit C [Streptomyces sp. ACA25]MDB1087728.1 cation:proton antiporter subunit C [Streptomyces sp. ACA25]